LFSIVEFPWLHHTPSLVYFSMDTKACAEADAVPAPFSLLHQWVKIGKLWWVRQGIAGLKYEVG
jgi:hypothetical protein